MIDLYNGVFSVCINSIMSLKTPTCACSNCRNRGVVVVGDCMYCKMRFCTKHRLPESHSCGGISLCKQVALDRNTASLVACKCVASKLPWETN
jgi:predicted nucleic acid binding AN1-type Zn finger protein